MKDRKFRRIWGKPWDWYYLLHLEQVKLKEMADYFEKKNRFVGVEKVVKDIRICIKLIDIICEKDAPYKSWLHQNYGKPLTDFEHFEKVPFSKYINVKNANRFLKTINYVANPDSRIYQTLLVEYRKMKALALYNKIRTYKLFSWWD